MGIYVRDFQADDILGLDSIEGGPRPTKDLAERYEREGMSVTGVRNGEVVGCGGVHPLGNGSGELWLALSKSCKATPIETLLWLREGLQIIIDSYGLRRLQALVRTDFEKSIRLLEYFDFRYEGCLREHYAPGISAYVYGRIL